ncbi:Gfo/Idh/MocA family protein [Rothia halotolerans]|uniref:Gfo/Idh/MocA family protein n=1 Tax=Rothia halotolerans TaxID=405770 RepID=UPI003B50DBAB
MGASHWHMPLYQDAIRRRHVVLAVQDDDPQAATELASFLDAPATTLVEEAIAYEGLELAYVLSAHDKMADVVQRLIERGIPFVLEKPGGVSLAEVERLSKEARLAGVPSAVAFVQRDAPVESWLRRAGTIFYERMTFIAGPPQRYPRAGNAWMLDPDRSGGGSFLNLGPHFVDLALRHIGSAPEITLRTSSALHQEAIEDHATLILSNEGREAIVEVGYAFPDAPTKRFCNFAASGTEGFVSIDTDGRATFTDYHGQTEHAVIEVDSDPLYADFVDHVADSLSSGMRDLPGLEDLLLVMEVVWATSTRHGDSDA